MTADAGALSQWLVLTLDTREYALPVPSVAEVLRMAALTPLPETPAWIAGILNLRGRGIMVMDLRSRLGLPAKAPDLGTQIVIVDKGGEPLGLIADDVTEIITLPPSALTQADKRAGASPLLSALAHAGERLILILDVERLANSAAAFSHNN